MRLSPVNPPHAFSGSRPPHASLVHTAAVSNGRRRGSIPQFVWVLAIMGSRAQFRKYCAPDFSCSLVSLVAPVQILKDRDWQELVRAQYRSFSAERAARFALVTHAQYTLKRAIKLSKGRGCHSCGVSAVPAMGTPIDMALCFPAETFCY